MNIILKTDSYKPTQWKQYPKGTTHVYSYFESRQSYESITFFGLQSILKKYFVGKVLKQEHIDQADAFFTKHFGRSDAFNKAGWQSMLDKYNGYLPLRIRAVPEGTTVSGSNALFVVENTDPEFFWLTNYVETILTHVWYPTTVATNSKKIWSILNFYNNITGAEEGTTEFQMHDFGYRGVSSEQTAALGGLANLLFFFGTDNLSAIEEAEASYNTEGEMIGFSIPASEHSTMTSWTQDGEVEAMRNMLTTYPEGMIACVSDSYDIMRAVTDYWGGELKDLILNREGCLVVRPDSGDPVVTTQKVIEALWQSFGGTVNEKGYKVLHPNIRVIQGDGIDKDMLVTILKNLYKLGFSSENIAFGSGGGLLQKFNRDTFKFAFKCSSITIKGEGERDVRKFPKEWDRDGNYKESFKISKSGRIELFRKRKGLYYTSTEKVATKDEPMFHTVFENGHLLVDDTFNRIRNRAKA